MRIRQWHIARGRWLKAPRWVNLVYAVLEWIEYHVADTISDWARFRYGLLDRHCKCEQCKRRRHA